MAYSGLPNGNITWATNELVTSAKMNLFSANQADIAQYLQNFDPNNGELKIKVNGTTLATFTADDINNVDADIQVPTKVTDLSDAGNYALANTIPTKVSDLTNDEGYVKASDFTKVNDAALTLKRNGIKVATFTANEDTDIDADFTVPDYITDLADADQYYTKNQTNDAIAAAISHITSSKITFVIVDKLPTTSIDTSTVYLVHEESGEFYEQWMYINNAWAHIGTTKVDLNEYALKTDIPTVPPVYDTAITIKKHNGELLDTFTLNQSNPTTITLPDVSGSLDTALDKSSTNGVQNQAIANALHDAEVKFVDGDNTEFGKLTVNQTDDSTITLPAASSKYGLVKIVTSTTDIGEGAALSEGTIYCVISA